MKLPCVKKWRPGVFLADVALWRSDLSAATEANELSKGRLTAVD